MSDYVASSALQARKALGSPSNNKAVSGHGVGGSGKHPRKKFIADYMQASASTEHPVVVNLTRASVASSSGVGNNRNSINGSINPMILKHLNASQGSHVHATGVNTANYNEEIGGTMNMPMPPPMMGQRRYNS